MRIEWRPALALALLAAASAACAHVRPAAEASVMKTQEWRGMRGGPQEPGTATATDAASWNAVWRRVGQEPPPLDLEKFVGVAVYLGQRPTGGWHTDIAAQQRGDDLIVRWKIVKPMGFVTQVLTTPWDVQTFARPKGKLILEAAPE
ncbi:MAG: protease complex subunit PrcB family protein [Elusimicrobia bacterium]|nr:protease complex subunit PrcB family protein [Elusimicrobiota bacterium]